MEEAHEDRCEVTRNRILQRLCKELSAEESYAVQQHLHKCPDCQAYFLSNSASQFFATQDIKRQVAQHAAHMFVDDVGIARIA